MHNSLYTNDFSSKIKMNKYRPYLICRVLRDAQSSSHLGGGCGGGIVVRRACPSDQFVSFECRASIRHTPRGGSGGDTCGGVVVVVVVGFCQLAAARWWRRRRRCGWLTVSRKTAARAFHLGVRAAPGRTQSVYYAYSRRPYTTSRLRPVSATAAIYFVQPYYRNIILYLFFPSGSRVFRLRGSHSVVNC